MEKRTMRAMTMRKLTIRTAAATVVLLAAALAINLAACGEEAGDCSAANCMGCCDLSGACVPGTAATACGRVGGPI